MRLTALLLALLLVPTFLGGSALGAPLPKLKVGADRRFVVTADGRPFFYLADTAWELFHRLDRKQVVAYLDLRARQRYTAIQAVALAELDGVTDPNAYGDLPLVDRNPARPAITPGAAPGDARAYDYWDHVDFVVDEANKRGLYIALLPTWGRWVTDKDKVFDVANARAFGEFLGKRYARKGIIWVLGGDRLCDGTEPVWRSMAAGVTLGATGKEDNHDGVLMTFHPRGGRTSAACFHDEPWLDFNMWQTGHSRAEKTRSWLKIGSDYTRARVKPVLDGEPLYEDHPIEFMAKELGYSFDAHVRQRAYWAVFAGAFGHAYGNHAVWQMYAPAKKPINGPLFPWSDAIHRPGAAQMRHLRNLIESRPMAGRVPDDALVEDTLGGADHIGATRGDGYAFYYSPQGRKFTAVLGKISGGSLNAQWYCPRTGGTRKIDGAIPNKGTKEFAPPSEGFGSDWVLVLDDAAKTFGTPGVLARR